MNVNRACEPSVENIRCTPLNKIFTERYPLVKQDVGLISFLLPVVWRITHRIQRNYYY